ncbi:MAG TPA: hypothetical protein VNR64_12405 [Vicinamibacterales bacterium]|nr:hypothetical protein [Vicinamibacterales bacterium]
MATALARAKPASVPVMERLMRSWISDPQRAAKDRQKDIALCRRCGLTQCARYLEAQERRRRQ